LVESAKYQSTDLSSNSSILLQVESLSV